MKPTVGSEPHVRTVRSTPLRRGTNLPLRIAVVGGGFAGAAAAIRIIEATERPLRLTIVEPRERLGRGLAYSTDEPGHLMNGAARGLSLYPEAPLHFARWLSNEVRWHGWTPPEGVTWAECQPPRRLFGAYVEQRLAATVADYDGRVRLTHRKGRAVAVGRLGDEIVVSLAEGAPVAADALVLASGVFRKGPAATLAADDSRLIDDPYAPGAFANAAAAKNVVVLGTGLAMLDTLVSLEAAGFRGRVRAVSRRGRIVEPRRPVEPGEAFAGDNVVSLRDILRQVQAERRALVARGEDWQRMVPAVREATPRLWTRLSAAEQARFVRHLQAIWRTCVHLAPVETHRLAERLLGEGRLVLEAGRFERIEECADGVAVRVRRADGEEEAIGGDLVVNCLGNGGDWTAHGDPLVRSLLDRGLSRLHPTGLGVDVEPETHAVIGASGRASDQLFAIGHPLRGAVWESTSVREIAAQARTLAEAVVQRHAGSEATAAAG